MCQVEEEYTAQLERRDLPSVSAKCAKCKDSCASVVIRAGDAYCRACFKEYFIHKFRAMLGKNRVIFPGDKVLLAVSGGPSSCSMLSQVQEGLSQNAHKKLRFFPGIVHIDEGGAVGLSAEDRVRTASELQAMFRRSGFPFHMVPLERVLELPSSVLVVAPPPSQPPAAEYKAAVDRFIQSDVGAGVRTQEQEETSLLQVEEAHTQALQQLMASTKTLTAREDLLSTLRQHLLVHTARSHGYSKLMLGDSSTRLAVRLLTSISLGRGAQLGHDTSFSDSRYGDIMSVRPMRDYSAKEIAFYNHLFHVPSVIIPSMSTKAPDKASIQRLTESFVTKLQGDFPSTVSTIYRTSEKLQASSVRPSEAASCERCLLCMCSLDTAVGNASAFQATLISQNLSNRNPQAGGTLNLTPEPVKSDSAARCCTAAGEDCGRVASTSGCCSSAQPAGGAELESVLCYSCRLTVREVSSVERLPQYILSEAQRRRRRSQLREEIQDFLLEDGDEGD